METTLIQRDCADFRKSLTHDAKQTNTVTILVAAKEPENLPARCALALNYLIFKPLCFVR